MNKAIKSAVVILLAILIFTARVASGSVAMTVIGSWSELIDETDVVTAAGSDLRGTYESSLNQLAIGISGTTDASDAWRVDVRRIDTTWHNDLHLWVRRTSDGTGTGSISDGTNYMEVTLTDQAFFCGTGDRSTIEAQLKLTGVSIHIPPGTYSTTLYYTIVDL